LPFLVKQMPVSAAVVPLFKATNLHPAFMVLKITPPVPTAYPVVGIEEIKIVDALRGRYRSLCPFCAAVDGFEERAVFASHDLRWNFWNHRQITPGRLPWEAKTARSSKPSTAAQNGHKLR